MVRTYWCKSDCGAQGPEAEEEDRAIALWNTRINQHISQEEKL